MGKKDRVSFFESYASSLNPNDDYDYNPPLPDSMRTSTLLEQMGKERDWTDEQVEDDIAILEKNRLYFVRDLRVLSSNSWSMIEIIPLLRDLLRQAIDPDWAKKEKQAMYSTMDTSRMEYKAEKKKKKKEKKEKKKKMGEPVVFRGRDEVAMAENNNILTSPEMMQDVLSQDPETIRNTIRNGSIDMGKEEDQSSGGGGGGGDGLEQQKKSVSFSSQNGTIPQQSTPTLVDSSDDNSSSPSSSSSSSSSSSDEDMTMINKQQQQSQATSNSASSFGLRPIKPVSPNRIQVKTATGQVYECDRFCPHKGVDLTTWGQVLGNTLVCTKHNWRFGLDGNGLGNKGRSVHPCEVNDW